MIRSPGLALIALILAALGLIFLAAAPSAPPPSARTLRGRPPLQSVLDVPDSPEKLDRTALHVPAFPASYLALSRTLEAAIREAGGSDVDPDFLPLEGHSGQVLPQTMFYSLLIKDNLWIRRVCEVGFNAGHSALTFLASRANVRYTAFDLPSHKYSSAARSALASLFPGRVEVFDGDSRDTVPKFAEKHPKTCDLISVDGGHQYEVAIEDLKNTRRLAAEQNFLLMDDTRCSSSYCEEPTKAWVEAIKKGWVEEMGCWTDAKGLRGWCLGRFV